jgi:hypothetical protein
MTNIEKEKCTAEIYFLYQKLQFTYSYAYIRSKLQEKLSALKREHPALQKT